MTDSLAGWGLDLSAPKRLHNSRKPLGTLVVHEQQEGVKPRGLWYGVGDAWLDWCASEMPKWIGKHTYEIVVRPDAKLLTLDTVGAILHFHEEYADSGKRWSSPDWARVAATYDGIEIAPYQWSLRLDGPTTWYYGWDCASGCIWNPRALASVRAVEVEQAVGVLAQTQDPGTQKTVGGDPSS